MVADGVLLQLLDHVLKLDALSITDDRCVEEVIGKERQKGLVLEFCLGGSDVEGEMNKVGGHVLKLNKQRQALRSCVDNLLRIVGRDTEAARLAGSRCFRFNKVDG